MPVRLRAGIAHGKMLGRQGGALAAALGRRDDVMARSLLIVIAAIYSLMGITAVAIGFVIPSDGPLAAAYALLLGAPWTFLLSAIDGYSDSMALNIFLVTTAIVLNAALLWLWALTRRRRPSELERTAR